MAFDAYKNLSISTVATAPSPAASGTTLVVAAGEGTRFPTPPFDVTIGPASAIPTPANAEIARCTALSTDTLTLTRGTPARSVLVGDVIVASFTKKFADDSLDAGNLTVGTLLDARLSANVARRDLANTFTQAQTIQGDINGGGNLSEKGRTTPLGHWITIPYSGTDFTAYAAGAWTVDSGDVLTLTYTLIGKTAILNLLVFNTSVSGSPAELRFALPSGLVASATINLPFWFLNAGGWQLGACQTTAGAGYLRFMVNPSGSAWPTITDGLYLYAAGLVIPLQ